MNGEIKVYISDWNKDHFYMYETINLYDYKTDLERINAKVSKANYMDGDVYYELIDHDGTDEAEAVYSFLYKLCGSYGGYEMCVPKFYEEMEEFIEEHGADALHYWDEFNDGINGDYKYIQADSFRAPTIVEDLEEYFELYYPEMYAQLCSTCMWAYFDHESWIDNNTDLYKDEERKVWIEPCY